MGEYVYLESDGKLLLVYGDGSGPAIPQSGRIFHDADSVVIRLPTEEEIVGFGIVWETIRTNKFRLGQEEHTVCLLYTSPSPRDATLSRMPSSA